MRAIRRRLLAGACLLTVALIAGAVPLGARAAGPGVFVKAELAFGGQNVFVATTNSVPSTGLAYLNGKRLKIQCLRTGRALYGTYNPIYPVVYSNYFALQGKLPDGKIRWIIGSYFAPFASLIVRAKPGTGPCGTDALASANLAVGYALII